MIKIQACLFDLDGVLVDSETKYTEFWGEIGRRYRPDVPTLAMDIKGTTLPHILGTYFAPDIHAAIISALDEQERTMRYDIKPGVTELLESLRQRRIPAVMVTSSNDRKMANLWAQHRELRDYFKCIVTADMVTRSKPDPEGYLLGARMAEAPAERCVVFEDSQQGVMAGRSAGAFVVGVAGTLPAETLRPWSDIVVDTLLGFDIASLAQDNG